MLDRLSNGIPLAEASAYFINLRNFEKTADEHNVGSSSYAPPDETGALEGQFAAPVEQVLAQMAKMVQNELKTQFAYMVYANSLRDFSHGSIAEEFEDHAGNETEHADFLLRRMSVIGGPVHIPDIPSPPAATDPHEIINTMIRMEQEGIKNWRILRELVGDDNPMRFKIEEYLTREQEHLDELWQLLPHQSNPAVLMQQQMKAAAARLKEKNSQMPMTGGLPPTAMGQQQMSQPPMAPLSGASAGQHKMAAGTDEEQAAAGRSRAIANLASGFTSDKHTRGERVGDLIGRVVGATGGLYAGKNLGHGGSLAATLGGAALGQHLGGRIGKAVGQEVDARNFEKKFASALRKMANEQLMAQQALQPVQGLPEVTASGGEDVSSYLSNEQQGLSVEQDRETAFYRQKFQQAAQQLQGLQQQSAQLQQQVAQQNELHQQALAQAKQIQEAAMQNSAAAHQAATAAMQQSLMAQQQEMQQAQMAVSMRDAVHAMRESMLQAVQQQLPPATPAEAGGSVMAPGQDNSQQPDAVSEGVAPGQPGASPDAGTPPQSATPGDGSGPGTNPNAGAGAEPTMQGATPQGQLGVQEGQPKVGSAMKDKLLGALAGGALGAGGTYLESRMSNDPLKEKIKRLEAIEQAGGGFANSLNMAQAKARLAVGEFTNKHPLAASMAGGALGAMTGAGTAPYARKIIGG